MTSLKQRIIGAIDRSLARYKNSSVFAGSVQDGAPCGLTRISAIPFETGYVEGALGTCFDTVDWLVSDSTMEILKADFVNARSLDKFYLFDYSDKEPGEDPEVYKIEKTRPFERINAQSGWRVKTKRIQYNDITG